MVGKGLTHTGNHDAHDHHDALSLYSPQLFSMPTMKSASWCVMDLVEFLKKLEGLHTFWTQRGYLTEKQYAALKLTAARRCPISNRHSRRSDLAVMRSSGSLWTFLVRRMTPGFPSAPLLKQTSRRWLDLLSITGSPLHYLQQLVGEPRSCWAGCCWRHPLGEPFIGHLLLRDMPCMCRCRVADGGVGARRREGST